MESIKLSRSTNLTNLTGMKRDDVVPYYLDMLINRATNAEVIRVNYLIINRWSTAALIYIKEKAWKQFRLRQES